MEASPYLTFTRDEWARHGGTAAGGAELDAIYRPLCRLLRLHIGAVQELHRAASTFLGVNESKVPYILAIAGSVSAGKSTTARLLRDLLAGDEPRLRVDLVTTDGFLWPNSTLVERGLMERKGFPESYDRPRLLRFVADVKSGLSPLRVPVYSHLEYDIVAGEHQVIETPDVVILEGLNVLQSGTEHSVFVSDFVDFSIYVDAPEDHLLSWFLDRFRGLRETAFRDERSYFRRIADVPEENAMAMAHDIWRRINLANLRENIAPTRDRARLILEKGTDHRVERILLRRF